MSIALVTDSTSDIPSELAQKNDIYIVPNLIIINGHSLEDGKDISREAFYERLPQMKTPPSTATASSGVYQTLYRALFRQGVEYIISIHAASRLSGIINAATSAAREFGERIFVQDSESVSLGLGFQALAASEAIARRLPLQEILTLLADVRRRVRLIAMLDTLEYVRRSGRVSWARARLGNLLQVKPFVEVRNGGQVVSLGEERTRKKGIARLKALLHNLGELERLAILHTNAENEARQFLSELSLNLAHEPLIVNVTTVIGAHVGPNGLGFAAVVK
ncbi:MAG: DegV family protein [Anaerolineales bacterium]|jgi:DegV family protein with EDD domain|nr:DegV family protein [Anaerolineales bacterium]